MRKFNFFIGALGGAMGGYLLSNKKLREKLENAKDANEAAKILGKEIQKNGKVLAREAKRWAESDDVQDKLATWKEYATDHADQMLKKIQSEAKKGAKKAKRSAKKHVKKAYRRTKKS